MRTILKISWRNIWRNKARSIVIILATGFGLWGGIASTSLMTGMLNQQFTSTIKNQVSHIQIHHPEFIRERQTESQVIHAPDIMNELKENPGVISFSARTLASGMVANASMTAAADIIGIDPDQELSTTSFTDKMIEGDYLTDDHRHGVILGAKLADKMKISLGNRVVLTFQDLHGNITSAAFKLTGIYRTSNTANDERFVYIRQDEMGELIGQQGVVNEIAILLDNIDNTNTVKEQLSRLYPENETRSWAEISPELTYVNEFSGIGMMVLLIIILLALAFGLLNTMLMTIFERTRELGVLMAVGMNKVKVFMMILLETALLIITGSVFGTILGALTVSMAQKTGVDLTSMGGDTLSDFGIDAVIYPYLDQMFYLQLALLVLMTAILASIYPAYKALKLKPAEAVAKD